MSTIGMVRDLAEFFLWVGISGAGIALVCAIVALVALAFGAAGIAGGASAAWIGGALLSLTSGFSGQWIPALAAVGGLVAALVLGGLARPLVRAFQARPTPQRPEVTASVTPPAPAPVSSVKSAPRIVGVRTVASESIR
ncbi:MAG TPA: hypothetical protein VNR69_08600 [Microbacterium sp.]|nr:hypothetical protein [Microbacterium sp.]